MTMSPPRIAVVDDEAIACREIARNLVRHGWEVETYLDAHSALEHIPNEPFDVVLCDLLLPDGNGLEILKAVRRARPEVEVIILTAYGTIDTAVNAIRLGAFHYVTKPLKAAEVRDLASRALKKVQLFRRKRVAQQGIAARTGAPDIIGESRPTQEMVALIEKVAPMNCNVLIEGESGTGKEVVARAIHGRGDRQDRPFIPFHCGSFAEHLVPNELFGHERGAFTGATERKIGLLEAGHNGTVFLDEIGTMPEGMQVKLLRFIQERSLLRLGGTEQVHVDVRLIAASNLDLKLASEAGTFRRDLYYRLNVVEIRLPPLRERMEDVPSLVHHFLKEYGSAFGKSVQGVSAEAMAILCHYPFPGNVRELENMIERAVVLADGAEIRAKDLPPDLQQLSVSAVPTAQLPTLAEKERSYIRSVLAQTGYNRTDAARILGISRTTLWRKMKQLGLA